MHPFADLGEVHETLQRMIERRLVTRLERRPGHKEERYAHLLEADAEQHPPASPPQEAAASPQPEDLHGLLERVASLEREVAELRAGMRDPEGR
jgi:uncharacterized protein YceH (UPF0502 family)